MSRIRSIHPGQWTDEDFVSLSYPARLLAIGLRNEADDNGVFEWKPIGIKMRLFPADNVDVAKLLDELQNGNAVKRFEVEGRAYGAIRNFRVYQRPKMPKARLPLPAHVSEYVGDPALSAQAFCLTSRPPLSPAVRAAVYERDGHVCSYCATTEPPFEIDHIHPVALGGSDDIDNLAVACRPCNRSKSAKPIDQWRVN